MSEGVKEPLHAAIVGEVAVESLWRAAPAPIFNELWVRLLEAECGMS